MQPIIEVKQVGKRYDITHQRGGYISLRDVIANVAKRPFSFLKHKAKSVAGLVKKEEFWALKDVSFNVHKGEVIGIIGRNGAGKSTLLKILSQITEPTEGEIILRGKVGSLLEVGTGFHPELSGRENIFLNGAILGMSRREIAAKFDRIVEFSGVEKFIDTPVKRYSSGMYVRLAFSVAAHMEPDILIVDEVLAVGDTEFQEKCLGKIEEVSGARGRTILFVSHNMNAIQRLCSKTILLEKGRVKAIGPTNEIIRDYLQQTGRPRSTDWSGDVGDQHARLKKTWIRSLDAKGSWKTDADLEVGVELDITSPIRELILGMRLTSQFGDQLAYVRYDDSLDPPAETIPAGPMIKRFIIPKNSLAEGTYRISFDIGLFRVKQVTETVDGELEFSISNVSGLGRRFLLPTTRGFSSVFRPPWQIL